MRYVTRQLGQALIVEQNTQVVVLGVQGDWAILGVLGPGELHQQDAFAHINSRMLLHSKQQRQQLLESF